MAAFAPWPIRGPASSYPAPVGVTRKRWIDSNPSVNRYLPSGDTTAIPVPTSGLGNDRRSRVPMTAPARGGGKRRGVGGPEAPPLLRAGPRERAAPAARERPAQARG